jgi:1-acyl-sn-glycerol-3-phosphate acyltransferase
MAADAGQAADQMVERGALRWAQWLFFALLVRPLVLLVLGINVRGREYLPHHGPAIIAANHNSHLDTLVLMSLMPLRELHRVRPVAAADYFLRNWLLAWFALRVIGILPLRRAVGGADGGMGRAAGGSLAALQRAIARAEIVLMFPEGSRGEPERPAALKPGIAHLARRAPEVPIIPVHLAGLGRALPRGEGLLVPFICDIHIGAAIYWRGDRQALMAQLCDWLSDRHR